MFVEPAYAQSPEYQEFWRKLNRGEYIAEEFKRIGKGGKEVWIQASYNPIFDLNGQVMKVVKFATDITDRVSAVNEIGAGLSRLAARRSRAPHRKGVHSRVRKAARRLQRLARDAGQSMLRDQRQYAGDPLRQPARSPTAADDLSRRTEQQAASLEETAAALDEITATVKKTAEGAKHARDVVADARKATPRRAARSCARRSTAMSRHRQIVASRSARSSASSTRSRSRPTFWL